MPVSEQEQQQAPEQEQQPNPVAEESEKAAVKSWLSRISRWERKWEPDFKRMRKNMEFAASIQWTGQMAMDSEKYILNLVLKNINSKVALLYAHDPTVSWVRKDKLDFRLWDGTQEQLMMAAMSMQAMQTGMAPPSLEPMALIMDYQEGTARRALIDKLCETGKRVTQHQMDNQQPNFKAQAKQLVRRIATCGVGYIRAQYCESNSDTYNTVSSMGQPNSVLSRLKRARVVVDKLDKQAVEPTSAEANTLERLGVSVVADIQKGDEDDLPQRIEYDFPPATSVIPSDDCKSLEEFVGASAVVIRYLLPLDEVNAIFGTDVKAGTSESEGATAYGPTGKELKQADEKDGDRIPPKVMLYEVFSKLDKTTFFLVKGWKKFIEPPHTPDPSVKGFWPITAQMFNSVVADDPESKATIFPPSDVQLMKSAQMEWNRTRNDLRHQRRANAPKYPIHDGTLTKADIEALNTAQPNQFVELKGLDKTKPPSDFCKPLQVAAIDPAVYDTRPLELDIQLAVGAQDANLGPAKPNVTATSSSIAENSRNTVAASNVDDLDFLLTRIMQITAEMCLRKFSLDVVQRIAGIGAVWPQMDQTRNDVINDIEVSIKAASSGRPNKALEMQNMKEVTPLLIQLGANPIAIIEELIRRWDERLDVQKFYPIPGLTGMLPATQQLGGAPQQPQPPSGAPPQQRLQDSSPVQSGPSGPGAPPPQY